MTTYFIFGSDWKLWLISSRAFSTFVWVISVSLLLLCLFVFCSVCCVFFSSSLCLCFSSINYVPMLIKMDPENIGTTKITYHREYSWELFQYRTDEAVLLNWPFYSLWYGTVAFVIQYTCNTVICKYRWINVVCSTFTL